MKYKRARNVHGASRFLVPGIVLWALGGLAVPVNASEFFVSPIAGSTGNGSVKSPWTLQVALGHPAAVRPGDTIWLKGGIYHPPDSNGFSSKLTGTADQPIIVRALNGEQPAVDGKGSEYALIVRGAYAWFWGIEVLDSSANRNATLSDGSHPNAYGVAIYGPGVRCINMIIHDTAQGISAFNEAADSEYYGNLVYYNGYRAPDRPHGHGLYLQNSTGRKLVEDNIVGDNFDEGIQIYGSAKAELSGFRVLGNILYNTSPFPDSNYQYNLIVAGGAVRRDIEIDNNFSYFTPERDYGFVAFGEYTPGIDMTIKDNIFVGGYVGVAAKAQLGPLVFTGNTVYVRPTALYSASVDLPEGSTYTWNNNRYFGLNRFYSRRSLSFAEWQQNTGFDSKGTFQPGAPTGVWIHVRKNRYENRRANIVVYNWDSSREATVDVSSVLATGDKYVVKDAQNFLAAPVAAGAYSGKPITIPLTPKGKSSPLGIPAPAHTGPRFSVLVLLPDGISK